MRFVVMIIKLVMRGSPRGGTVGASVRMLPRGRIGYVEARSNVGLLCTIGTRCQFKGPQGTPTVACM